jgi:hypothetical protein
MELASASEVLQELQTERLLRQAWRYYIAPPEKPRTREDEDDTWEYGWLCDTWHLKRAGIAALQRQIEEAQQRRRVARQSWVTLLGPMLTALAALMTAIVSLALTLGR